MGAGHGDNDDQELVDLETAVLDELEVADAEADLTPAKVVSMLAARQRRAKAFVLCFFEGWDGQPPA